MCNLYSLNTTQEELARLFGALDRLGNQPPLPSVFPGYDAPVCRLNAHGERELVSMSWGFVLPQHGKAPKRVTNARDNKLLASPFWRPSFNDRRCLVPASSYAEPKGRKPATWHWFGMKGDQARPPFAFAGIWSNWRGALKGEPVDLSVYTIVTTDPNSVVKPIYPNRMPVIIGPDDYQTWLSGSPQEALSLARPFPAQKMTVLFSGESKEDPTE